MSSSPPSSLSSSTLWWVAVRRIAALLSIHSTSKRISRVFFLYVLFSCRVKSCKYIKRSMSKSSYQYCRGVLHEYMTSCEFLCGRVFASSLRHFGPLWVVVSCNTALSPAQHHARDVSSTPTYHSFPKLHYFFTAFFAELQ